jgi:hypothetical protein
MFDRLKSMAASLRSTSPETTPVTHPGDPATPQAATTTFRADDVSPAATITFPVDDVAPAADPLWMSTLSESLELRSGSRILIMPEGEIPALAPEGYHAPTLRARRAVIPQGMPEILRQQTIPRRKDLRAASGQVEGSDTTALLRRMAAQGPMLHPLLQAIHLAFSQHRPLILSPDSIWLAIVQGFGHHVYEHAEALRDRIVRHEEKKDLVVETISLDAEHWPRMTAQFSAAIRANSDQVLFETLMCKFSTTTPSIQTAMEIALMDVYERYFNYACICVCGIPKITVQGTPADWRRMRERIEVLATYDLGWWTSRLAPILDEFVATAEGRPDRKFWQSIYKPRESYGDEVASGWITDLFPYLGDRPERRRNETLTLEREDWVFVTPDEPGSMLRTVGVGLKSFPSGLSLAPVKVKVVQSGVKIDVDLIGGFAGVGQQMDDNALFPIISWAVAERNEEKQNVAPLTL